MTQAKSRKTRTRRRQLPEGRIALTFLLLMLTASCVNMPRPGPAAARHPLPATSALADADAALPQAVEDADAGALGALTPEEALAANQALPLAPADDFAARPVLVHGLTPLDQFRAADCLAQAVYYEARSESEDGQRAVAQVVLNRVMHPAYPASVCGVVYQGPLRPGGGCQFTFTCDGSLAIAPSGDAWIRARRIAAEALDGRVYPQVGHATHYHTLSVFPLWAPTLVKSAIIGNHIFYRLPGAWGAPAAFRQSYTGREPLPVPSRILVRPRSQLAALSVPLAGGGAPIRYEPASAAGETLPQIELSNSRLPSSAVREAYLNAGRWRDPRMAPTASADAGTATD